MLQRARRALESHDAEGLLRALAEAVASGSSPNELVEVGLDVALTHPLRGSRWTDAVLALATASFLSDRIGAEVGLPAAVSALHFLAGSEPGPRRDEHAAPPPVSRIAWFEAGTAHGVGGWGRHVLVARAGWALAGRLPHREVRVREVFVAHWQPRERDRSHEAAVAGGGPVLSPGFDGLARVREARVHEVLSGDADESFPKALAAGEPADTLAAATAMAAVRACAVLPGLRQVHGVLVARAMLEAASVPGLDVRGPLIDAARFVGEGWGSGLRSGRLPDALAARAFEPEASPPGESLEQLAAAGAPLDLTLSWGHPLRLVDAALALRERLADAGSGWLEAAVAASSQTWPKSKRPWLSARGGHV